MTQVEITPFNAGQISQTNDVQTQNPVGNANNKSVQANRQWNKTSISKKSNARNSFTQNHKIGRRPSGSLSTPNTSLKGSKITIGTSGKRNSISEEAPTPVTPQNQSVETPKTPRPSFASTKNTKPSGGERDQATIGKNRSMPQAQAQPEVTQQRSDMEMPKTPQRTFGSLNLHNTKQEKNYRDKHSPKFSIGKQRLLNEENIARGVLDFQQHLGIEDETKARLLAKLLITSNESQVEIKNLFSNYDNNQLEEIYNLALKNPNMRIFELRVKYNELHPVQTNPRDLIQEKLMFICASGFSNRGFDANDISQDQKKAYDKLEQKQSRAFSRIPIYTPNGFKKCCQLFNETNNDKEKLNAFFKDLEHLANKNKLMASKDRWETKLNVEAIMKLATKHDINFNFKENTADVKTSKIQSHKPTKDKVPVKSQTTVQTTTPTPPKVPVKSQTTTPTPPTQNLTQEQIKLRNECATLIYSSWKNAANGIITAFIQNCPSEEKLREFKEFFIQNWNNEALVKNKVYELTGISVL